MVPGKKIADDGSFRPAPLPHNPPRRPSPRTAEPIPIRPGVPGSETPPLCQTVKESNAFLAACRLADRFRAVGFRSREHDRSAFSSRPPDGTEHQGSRREIWRFQNFETERFQMVAWPIASAGVLSSFQIYQGCANQLRHDQSWPKEHVGHRTAKTAIDPFAQFQRPGPARGPGESAGLGFDRQLEPPGDPSGRRQRQPDHPLSAFRSLIAAGTSGAKLGATDRAAVGLSSEGTDLLGVAVTIGTNSTITGSIGVERNAQRRYGRFRGHRHGRGDRHGAAGRRDPSWRFTNTGAVHLLSDSLPNRHRRCTSAARSWETRPTWLVSPRRADAYGQFRRAAELRHPGLRRRRLRWLYRRRAAKHGRRSTLPRASSRSTWRTVRTPISWRSIRVHFVNTGTIEVDADCKIGGMATPSALGTSIAGSGVLSSARRIRGLWAHDWTPPTTTAMLCFQNSTVTGPGRRFERHGRQSGNARRQRERSANQPGSRHRRIALTNDAGATIDVAPGRTLTVGGSFIDPGILNAAGAAVVSNGTLSTSNVESEQLGINSDWPGTRIQPGSIRV